jgi:hypothetical protein
MANIPETYRCDLSGRVFPSRSDVRGGLSLDTGDRLLIWPDVSPASAKRLLELIDAEFPKNTPTARPAVLPQSSAMCSDREGICEPDKCTCS